MEFPVTPFNELRLTKIKPSYIGIPIAVLYEMRRLTTVAKQGTNPEDQIIIQY